MAEFMPGASNQPGIGALGAEPDRNECGKLQTSLQRNHCLVGASSLPIHTRRLFATVRPYTESLRVPAIPTIPPQPPSHRNNADPGVRVLQGRQTHRPAYL